MKSSTTLRYSLLVIIATFIGCISAHKNTVPSSSQHNQLGGKGLTAFTSYIFKGKITDSSGTRCYANMEAIGDSGLIKGVSADFETGGYDFKLVSEIAIKTTHFRVTAYGYDTLIKEFEISRLKDSIIEMNFELTLLPFDTVIIKSYPSHRLFPRDSIKTNQR